MKPINPDDKVRVRFLKRIHGWTGINIGDVQFIPGWKALKLIGEEAIEVLPDGQDERTDLVKVQWLKPHRGFSYFGKEVCFLPASVASGLLEKGVVIVVKEDKPIVDETDPDPKPKPGFFERLHLRRNQGG